MRLPWSSKRGFTLIELLVVISIIGILITLVAVTVLPVQRKGRDSRRKADINLVLSGLGLFNADFKVYPNYTFYLGTNTTDTGAANSSLGLEDDVPTCNGNLSGGDTSTFTSDGSEPSTAGLTGSTTVKLKPGFVSINNLLICLKYLDKLVQDPKATTDVDKYHYRVNYDYSEFLLGAQLENTNDPDARTLQGAGPERYWVGNGVNSRQLDDDSDLVAGGGGGPVPDEEGAGGGSGFYSYSPSIVSTLSDGKYFYQCATAGNSSTISLDNRSTVSPFKYNGTSWVANTGATTTTCAATQPNTTVVAGY